MLLLYLFVVVQALLARPSRKSELLPVTGLLSFFLVLISLLSHRLILTRTVVPLVLSLEASRIDAGNTHSRLSALGHDEVSALTQAFNGTPITINQHTAA